MYSSLSVIVAIGALSATSAAEATLLRNWCFWLPVQFVQFNFIPAEFNVTFTAAFGVIWNAILSWSTAAGKPAVAEKEA